MENEQINKDLEAVKQNGLARKYNEQINKDLEAVKQKGRFFQFVKNQTEELCIESVKQNGLARKYEVYYVSY